MPQNSQEHTTNIREKYDRWCIHRVVEAPHAIDATIPRMFKQL